MDCLGGERNAMVPLRASMLVVAVDHRGVREENVSERFGEMPNLAYT